MTKHHRPCVVCSEREGKPFMCAACGRSYDRALARDGTVMGAIIWAANRARRFERNGWAKAMKRNREDSELADAAIAELEAIQSQRDDYAEALREIHAYRAEHEPLRLDNEGCEACRRNTERQWPPSGLCDRHYRMLADNRDENARRDAGQHWAMRHIAERALDPHRILVDSDGRPL